MPGAPVPSFMQPVLHGLLSGIPSVDLGFAEGVPDERIIGRPVFLLVLSEGESLREVGAAARTTHRLFIFKFEMSIYRGYTWISIVLLLSLRYGYACIFS